MFVTLPAEDWQPVKLFDIFQADTLELKEFKVHPAMVALCGIDLSRDSTVRVMAQVLW